MGPERRYQTKLIDKLREAGAYIVKYPAGPHGTVGTPDLLACYRGHFIAIEVKAGDPTLARYRPTTSQQRQLNAIKHAGGVAIIAQPAYEPSLLLDDLDAMLNLADQVLADQVGA